MRSSLYLPVATGFALGARAAAPLYKSPVNIPGYGSVQGAAALDSSVEQYVSNWENISFFGGIPFGADTSGANRWRAPQPAAPWNGTLNATAFGPICAQSNQQLEQYSMSEDCLSLNIWTSATSSDEKLPVALWSYGAGTAPPQSGYNGAGVASKGIIFVSYNYRAGILGFFAGTDLPEAPGTNATGNWGVLDQVAALKWVHENIAAFGGDPDHITVIGQSFGSGATYHMVNSPLTVGNGIVNAICESGVTWPSDPYTGEQANAYISQSSALTVAASGLAAMNVSSVAQARQLSYSTIFSLTGSLTMSFLPILDYYSIPDTYMNSLVKGAANKVPYLAGFNADESGASSTLTTTASQYESFVGGFYGNLSTEVLALWPAPNDTEAAVSESQLVREEFRISTWKFMTEFANASDVDTYTYFWTHGPPDGEGASHGSEIVYVLGNLWAQSGVNYTSDDYYISNVMSSYWANFMKTSDPNTGSSYDNGTLPATWDVASTTAKKVFEVGNAWKMVPVASDEKIEVITEFFAQSTVY